MKSEELLSIEIRFVDFRFRMPKKKNKWNLDMKWWAFMMMWSKTERNASHSTHLYHVGFAMRADTWAKKFNCLLLPKMMQTSMLMMKSEKNVSATASINISHFWMKRSTAALLSEPIKGSKPNKKFLDLKFASSLKKQMIGSAARSVLSSWSSLSRNRDTPPRAVRLSLCRGGPHS